ncbi:hypothetical protein [Allobranchiibius sp. GilTou38]|uniref:hypothetical protein n=1 Tax=Allobranchiibius sp. GilTou38 TaxID=2815210 RepID=UPI001AA1C39C|nr:hypothetical protein [Allobranchiibius sp. GilTou38]MBO1765970.1 hypothetical protein [Allobranchiibius sp. GilTou38]
MSDDIETLLRHADAPAMGVSAREIIAGARRTRRRRRARYGAYGLAAALVIGVGVGADRVVANHAQLTPATESSTGPLGALFAHAKLGENHFDQYVVSGTADDLEVRVAGSSSTLRRIQHLNGGASVFRDGSQTIVATPLPRTADQVSVRFTTYPTNLRTASSAELRLNPTLNVDLEVTDQPVTVRAVLWSSGADFRSTTGERAQVATFGNTQVYWYERFGVYGVTGAQPVGDTSGLGSFVSGSLSISGRVSGDTSHFAATVPHGARDVSVGVTKGDTANPPQIRRLGDTAYDVVYVTGTVKDPSSADGFVQSVSWTDMSGRHTKSYN